MRGHAQNSQDDDDGEDDKLIWASNDTRDKKSKEDSNNNCDSESPREQLVAYNQSIKENERNRICANEEDKKKKKRQQAKPSNNNSNKIMCRRSRRSSRRVSYCDAGTSPVIDRRRLQAERMPPESETKDHTEDAASYRGLPLILCIEYSIDDDNGESWYYRKCHAISIFNYECIFVFMRVHSWVSLRWAAVSSFARNQTRFGRIAHS